MIWMIGLMIYLVTDRAILGTFELSRFRDHQLDHPIDHQISRSHITRSITRSPLHQVTRSPFIFPPVSLQAAPAL